jgi:hypothetical protein
MASEDQQLLAEVAERYRNDGWDSAREFGARSDSELVRQVVAELDERADAERADVLNDPDRLEDLLTAAASQQHVADEVAWDGAAADDAAADDAAADDIAGEAAVAYHEGDIYDDGGGNQYVLRDGQWLPLPSDVASAADGLGTDDDEGAQDMELTEDEFAQLLADGIVVLEDAS